MSPEGTSLGFQLGLTIVLVAGASGGLVSAAAMLIDAGIDDKRHYIAAKRIPMPVFLFARALIGVGGGVAVLFAALSIGRYSGPPTSVDLLSLSALCFIAGSIGHRILPRVAAQLERQISEVKEKVEAVEDRAERAEQEAVNATREVQLAREVGLARTILASHVDAPALLERTRETLEQLRQQHPRDRGVNIVLARLYMKHLKDLERAEQVLTSFIERLVRDHRHDADQADAWFNLACYYSLALRDARGDARAKLIDKALPALRKSIAILATNLDDAATDPDLQALRETPEWVAWHGTALMMPSTIA
jgi:hypothetical protein